MLDLVERLTEASRLAIENERPSLEHRPETVRGLTIELTIGKTGQLGEAVCYVERRTQGTALLGRHQSV